METKFINETENANLENKVDSGLLRIVKDASNDINNAEDFLSANKNGLIKVLGAQYVNDALKKIYNAKLAAEELYKQFDLKSRTTK